MLATATPLDAQAAKIVVLLAATCSICCFGVVVLPSLADAVGWLRVESRHKCVALVALALACLVWAQKPDGGGDDGDLSGGTNDVTQVSGTNDTDDAGLDSMGLLMMDSIAPDLSPVIDATDIVRGYRLESSTVNELVSYEKPEGVSPAGTWHLTGAYDDVLSVGLDGFVFPLGRELCSSLWAYTWGTARPRLRNLTNELVAVGAPMSAVPGVSRFWTAQTTNDTVLLTWENFTLGRIPVSTGDSSLIPHPSSLLSAQLELFRSGDFIARSNDVESVYRRINPDDWDDDGIENDLDEEPTVYDEDGFGPHQELPQDARTNFYYWVDLVVSSGNALVEFEGDGESDLPDPRFIARAGETNRVYLLIGKTYQAQCILPMVCVAREDEDVQVSPGVSGLQFIWDVTLEYITEPPLLMMSPLLSAPLVPGGIHAVIQPERARGGLFDWPGSFCCYYFDAEGAPVFACAGNCGCGGGCHTGDISYTYVGYSRAFSGWSCSCSGSGGDDSGGGGEDPEDDPEGPSASASFSKDAVIFEEAYTNMPGVVVPRQSTEVEVSYYVYGGTNGGTYAFTLLNGSRLELVSGGTLPVTGHVAASESRTITARYRGRLPSASENDVEAVATFVEDVTARTLPAARDQMTAVKVALVAQSDYPANKSRHVFGPLELFDVQTLPSCYGLVDESAPGSAGASTIHLGVGDVDYSIGISVIYPSNAVSGEFVRTMTDSDWTSQSVTPLCAGVVGAGFVAKWRLQPTYVSFANLEVVEGYAPMENKGGCFLDETNYPPSLYEHNVGAGAERVVNVSADNQIGNQDFVGVQLGVPPATNGCFSLVIPLRWGLCGGPYNMTINNLIQTVNVTAEGTTVLSKGELSTTREVNQ